MTNPFSRQLPDHFGDVGMGWTPIMQRLHQRLVAIDPNYSVDRVREKFGGLHVYLHNIPELSRARREQIRDALWAAEEQSYQTCEECGRPGTQHTPSREIKTREPRSKPIRTLCDTCAGEGIDILKEVDDAHR